MRRRTKTKKVIALIKSRGLKHDYIAREILEIHPVSFSKILHNKDGFKLNPQKIPALAETLGVSPNEISYLFGLPKLSSNFEGGGI